jgi:excisionase family DNA binding protein
MSVSSVQNSEVQSPLVTQPKRKRRSYDSMANPPEPGAFKLKPAASYLSVSEPTLRRLVDRGLIKPNRALRHLIFSRAELDRFLSSGQ